MPGMGQAPQTDDPTVVSAFHTALAHQGLLILAPRCTARHCMERGEDPPVPQARRICDAPEHTAGQRHGQGPCPA